MHRILQYIALILIFTAMAGGYWYWKSQAAVRINQGLEDSLEQGLVGYWKLDDASGTTATDSSGNGNNGTLTNGPTWGTGQVGGGVTFDGSNDYVSIPNSNNFAYNQDFSVSTWVKIPATQNDVSSIDNSIVEKWAGVGGYPYVIRVMNQSHATPADRGKIAFARYDGTNNPGIPSAVAINDNQWHLVTARKSGSTLALFVDGTAQATATDTTTGTTTNNTPIFLGTRGPGSNLLTGSIDETRIYNRSLSDEEVRRLYQTTAPTGIDTGLVGYWPFDGDDISGTTASDRSGKGNHGTITSGTTKTLGKAGQALDFSAGNGVQVDSLTQTGQTYTFATWAKVTSCVNEYVFDTVAGRLVLACANRTMAYYDGTWKSVGSANSIPLNEWVHLTWVLNSSSGIATGYINGISVGTSSYVGQNIGTTTRIGNYYAGGAAVVQGTLDDFRIYNRALTAAEVQDLYQKTQSDTVGASNKRDSLALGLAGYWKLDDGSGTTAIDSSTNGNNGTLTNGPTWGTGQVGGGVSFDGTNDYVSIPNSNNFAYNQDFSVSTWVKIPATQNNTTSTGNSIIEKWTGGGGYPYVIRLLNQTEGTVANRGKVYFARYDGSNQPVVGSTTTLNDNQWHLVTARKSGSTLALFVDGSMQATATDTTTGTTTNSTPIYFGAMGPGSNLLTGSLDETRIYNRPLSDEEVKRLYLTTAPTGVDTGLKGYWSFDGPSLSGTKVSDWSGAGNTGTSSGGPVVAAGPMGQALQFDGVNDTISVNDTASLRLPLGGKMSIDFWYKSNMSSGAGTVYSKASGAGDSYGLNLLGGASTHTLAFYYRSYNGSSFAGIDNFQIPGIEKNVWHHVSSSYDMSTGVFNIYVDGVLVKTVTVAPNTNIASTGSLEIGTAGGQYFAGQIDELHIYNRILSVDEVREAYDYGKADKVNAAGSDPLTDGLTGYWKLDDASGTAATDSSGNGNNGTLTNGPTWTAGQVQGAVNFDGTNDYINIPSITAAQFGNTTFTFAGWIKTTGTQKYIAAQDRCNGGWGVTVDSFYNISADLMTSGACGAYAARRSSLTTITPNEWHHIVAVMKTDTSVGANNNITLYIDGVLNQDTLTTGGAYGATGANGLEISGRYTNDQLFSGPMDELRLYNRGLSAEEVRQLYHTTAPTGVDTGLVGYWSFDGPDVAGTTAYDRSGKGNHGSLVNSPSVIAGKIGQALSFDGSDDYAITAHNSALNAYPITVSTWVRTSVNDANRRYILNKYNFLNGYALNLLNGKIRAWYLTASSGTDYVYDGGDGMSSKTVVSDNQWHLVTFTVDASGGKLYIDGRLEDSMAWTGTPQATSTTEGVRWSAVATGGDKVAASLDETRIYSRALTSAEIQNLYNKGR